MTTSIKSTKNIKTKEGSKNTASAILISSVVSAGLANKRRCIAKTKDKAEVSGGGKKPWRQKGLGRARAGSNRSPLWTGGGITFGPVSGRNFSKRINKKQRNLVLLTLLEEKKQAGDLVVVDKIDFSDQKTKTMLSFLGNLKIDSKTTLILDNEFSGSEDAFNIYNSGRNLKILDIVASKKLSAHTILRNKWAIITKKAYEELTKQES